jgi:predicted nucleotidyltransferase
MLIESLFGKTRRKILALFFLNSDKQYYFSEVARATGIRQGAIQRELKSLVDSAILIAEKRGHQTFYSVNSANPIYSELRQIMLKAYAVGEVLAAALKRLSRKINAAFVYGSVASGTDTGISDIDLFVIGGVSFGDIAEAVSRCEDELARPVNIHTLTLDEFANKVAEKNHFVSSVMKAEKIFIIGADDNLRRMATEQMAEKGAVKRPRNSRPTGAGETKPARRRR